MDQIGMDQIGMDCIEWIALNWIAFYWSTSNCHQPPIFGFGSISLEWIALDCDVVQWSTPNWHGFHLLKWNVIIHNHPDSDRPGSWVFHDCEA